MKKCKLCGKEFEPSYHTVKFCCKEHAKESTRLSVQGKPRVKHKRVTRKNFSIGELTIKAKEAGMSYGQYVALNKL